MRRTSLISIGTGFLVALGLVARPVQAGPFPPAAGQPGSTAIPGSSPLFVGWASSVVELVRGPMDLANPALGLVSFGSPDAALGAANGSVVSLGDGGWITLGFDKPITNGPGFDFAVFENGFSDTFLELAFVEVSTNGIDFFRFPSVSLTQTDTQVGGFGALDPTNLHNLAGKYRAGFGTPFDLEDLVNVSPLLDVNQVRFVRIIDVVGSLADAFARYDSQGNKINDPYPTPFASGGFDLDAIGVIHFVPEPTGLALLALGLSLLAGLRPRRAG